MKYIVLCNYDTKNDRSDKNVVFLLYRYENCIAKSYFSGTIVVLVLDVIILIIKGDNMYECNIIEVEDFGFNHYIHHFDDYEGDGFGYKDELDFIYNLADCELDWE